MAISAEKNSSLCDALALSGHASWLLKSVTAMRSRQNRNKKVKEQKGRTWQPRTTTSTSNECCHNRATPFNCDTIQLLITLSGARRKATVSQAQARCLLNQRAGSGEKCAYCLSGVRKAAFFLIPP